MKRWLYVVAVVVLILIGVGFHYRSTFFPPRASVVKLTAPKVSSLKMSLTKPEHIVIVMEENHAYKKIIGNPGAPYMNQLAKQGASFLQSYGVTHPSQPNYIALFSGSTQGVSDDRCPYRFSEPNLATELQKKGLTFKGFSEDLPAVGYKGCRSGAYYRKHSPWVNFTNVSSSVNQPLTVFPKDYSALPTVAFVIPNINHDMHNGTIQAADQWLKKTIDPYVKWAKSHNSLLIVTWDEDDFTKANRIPTFMVGPMIKKGQYSEHINHYNVLRTIEEIYGLPLLGKSQNAKPIDNIWLPVQGISK
ncbi:MAG TPA: alkaline phosphatase family protein [Sporolactobacillaceae bacterium]|nr:alkaline phosphatase family protein [Sporolactobacillaceae bacterium]